LFVLASVGLSVLIAGLCSSDIPYPTFREFAARPITLDGVSAHEQLRWLETAHVDLSVLSLQCDRAIRGRFPNFVGQIQEIYGKRWMSILANCGIVEFFTPSDVETEEYLQRRGGITTGESRSRNYSGGLLIGGPS
jgi:hypothetical protein